MQERQLTDEERAEIRRNLESGMKVLCSEQEDLDPEQTDQIMKVLMNAISSESIFLPEAVSILMDCLEKTVGWKPVLLQGERFSGKAMVSPDGAYATYPELVIGKAIRNPDNSNLLLFFNMIRGGSLPPSSEGRYTILS